MAREFISSELTETYFADLGDEIFVTATGSILTDDDRGIFSRSYDDFNVDVTVHGVIDAAVVGVDLTGAFDGLGPSVSTVLVGQTGAISGQAGVVIDSDYEYDIRVAGHVSGSFSGIDAYAHSGQIHVSGVVEAASTRAIYFGLPAVASLDDPQPEGGLHSLTNTGIIRSTEGGAAFFTSGDLAFEVLNTGRIEGIGGIVASGSASAEIQNFGQISSDYVAIELSDMQTSAMILNRGTVTGEYRSLEASDSDVEVVNSGVISGEVFANSGHLTLHNTGSIRVTSGAAITTDFGELDLYNSGGIHGNVLAQFGGHIVNAGVIYGNVRLAYEAGTYHGRGTGYVTGEVFGAEGDDVLIGGDRSDRLRGGKENDRLVGNGGRDDLQGGSGDDRLNGGAGADRIDGGFGDDLLAGGSGADVFVFQAQSGADRVRDFVQGIDLMEIEGQTGGFGSLIIQNHGDDLEITYGGGTITLVDQADLVLSAADFDFV